MKIIKWSKIITLILTIIAYLEWYYGNLNIRLSIFSIFLLMGIYDFLCAYTFYTDPFYNRKKRALLSVAAGVIFIISSFVNLIYFLT